MPGEPYPAAPSARDGWILARRGPRNAVDPLRAAGAFVEEELTERGSLASVATLFLTNRECPWRCLMCDLWKNTTEDSVPRGAVPAQIAGALAALPLAERVKLYNSGSFFDPRAIPPEDHGAIASLLVPFERVIVESHPALVGDACLSFRDRLEGSLEVAVGLETAHAAALERLNKRMTVDDFLRAARRLKSEAIALRVFVLLGVPLLSPEESVAWTLTSVQVAFDAGATAVTIIPTRSGNGALEALQEEGGFAPPTLEAFEEAVALAVGLGRGRVFADLWDLGNLRRCGACFPARAARLAAINRTQTVPPGVRCACREKDS